MKAYVLKVTLDDSDPEITRTVAVPAHASFADLHSVMQSLMGWMAYHEHAFEADDRMIGPDYLDDCEDEETVPISEFHGKEIAYNYDFGDDWWLTIEWLDDIEDFGHVWPILMDWEEDSPPEDCGGIDAYYEQLDALSDPEHPDHDDAVEWFNIMEFDEEIVENSLQSWPIQGVRSDGCTIMSHMDRMAILGTAMGFMDYPMVFDMVDLVPYAIRKTKSRRSKKRDRNDGMFIDAKTVEDDPERYIPFLKPGSERIMDGVGAFTAKHEDIEWPAYVPNGANEEFYDMLDECGLDEEFNLDMIESVTASIGDWARRNSIYFRNDDEVNTGDSLERMLDSMTEEELELLRDTLTKMTTM